MGRGCALRWLIETLPINALHLMVEESQELGVLAVIASRVGGLVAHLAVCGLGAAQRQVRSDLLLVMWVYTGW